ncbi:TPA: common pilus major fimbrillin subunit EcpA [Kluyvera georgiana]
MNKKVVALAFMIAGITSANAAFAADTTAQAVATWSATAKKDTSSKLVVTPLGSLSFQYAEGVKGFSTQKGLFDVAVEGDATATGFKLTSRLLTNTLTAIDNSGSTLEIGVSYNGEKIEKTSDTTLIDTYNGSNGGNLNAIASGYNRSGRVTAQDAFAFAVVGGTTDGTKALSDYSDLPDGIWSGDVSVEFDATWTS